MNELDDGLATALSGHYVLERELGRGGMAVVYLARDLKHSRLVAVKVLRAEYANAPDNLRFAQEIQIAAQLSHPNILALHDSGEACGLLYYVMPYIDGMTLRQRLRQRTQLPIAELIAITEQIASALDYAHSQGVVHRDIKPENIFLQNGHVFIADFGIAKTVARGDGDPITGKGMLIGTPEYMSPEQCTPGAVVTAQSDVYALGCVVFEMAAGLPPFRGATAPIVMSHQLTTEPPALSIERRPCPSELERAVRRALAKVPADRFETASEFARACRSDETATLIARGRRRARKRSGAIAIVAALVAIIALGASVLTRPQERLAADVPYGDARRIAVLYFENLSPAVLPGYIVDGITEDLIDHLGTAGALHVLSPEGVRLFRNNNVAADSLGRRLKVGTIVSGSVARADSVLLIRVRLIDAHGGRQLYSRSLTLPLADLFTLQSKLGDEVAFLLRQRLGDEVALREHRAGTSSSAAWATAHLASDLTRQALIESVLRGSPKAPGLFLRADTLYARAAALDEHWPLPVVRRGHIALSLALGCPTPPPGTTTTSYARMDADERSKTWVERALQLADTALRVSRNAPEALELRADALYALARVEPSQRDSLLGLAESNLRSVVENRPDLAAGWATLAQVNSDLGRFAEASAAAQRAYDADAFFEVPRIASVGFFAALRAGQFDDARQWCRLGLDHYPGDPRFTECELTLLGWTGRSPRDIRRAWELVDTIESRDTLGLLRVTAGYRRLMVATLLARAGLADSARDVTTSALSMVPSEDVAERRGLLIVVANIRLLSSDRDGALKSLTEYLRAFPYARTQVANHAWFEKLRDDKRFLALTSAH